jgi:glucose uptake protein GlcU
MTPKRPKSKAPAAFTFLCLAALFAFAAVQHWNEPGMFVVSVIAIVIGWVIGRNLSGWLDRRGT